MANAKRWSYTTGEKGRNRVRAFEDAKTGIIHLEYYTPAPEGLKRESKSTKHRDRDRAKQQADDLAARFGRNEPPPMERVTLRLLFDTYGREVTPQKGESKQEHDVRTAEMFLRFFGPDRSAKSLNVRDWNRFVQARRSGAIGPAGRSSKYFAKRRRTGVGSRQIGYDLQYLLGVLNWATLAGDGRGGVLLERNPLKGLPLPKEESPQRPVIRDEEYRAMLAKAPEVDWRFFVAFVLAHETGHRIGAVRQLRWSDVDLAEGVIRWRAEHDKIGFEHSTPMTPAVREALEAARKENPGIGEAWVLPAPKEPKKKGRPEKPECSNDLLRSWWYRAEELAKLPRRKRVGWHSLRRKFAIELKADTPLKDLCHMGGWKNPTTVLTCYQQADEATMRRALENRKRLTAGGLA